MAMNAACRALAVAAGAVVLLAAGCGGGTAGTSGSVPTSNPPTSGSALPAGWLRCTNRHYGFSIGYPGSWHVATIDRLRLLGTTPAYRRRFFARVACFNADPRPFVVVDGSEFPQTAIVIYRQTTRHGVRNAIRWTFDPGYARTVLRTRTTIAGHRAVRFEVVTTGGLYPSSTIYGYLIDFGKAGGIEVAAYRYAHRPVSDADYRRAKKVADQMAPTVRAFSPGGVP